ncbi:MAG: helical backbone metal receptor [Algoriphagus sp.]|uniref:ABC transporter substrate-binding protein n=1 Tax=Algoriphagus sp. TaxID=1872435 RepID=UPI00262FEF47|nr:helical backbone metal receptor [Algoriphagus sp.]MDG1277510.1 helical backbone metal receptor [Algoriphagus sp.]
MNFLDQLNRSIFIPSIPKRIISLVPSQTELLVDLGLEDRIVGVTKFCVHPKGLRKGKTIIGGTKNYRFDLIDELDPYLIIGNKEENDQEGIEILMKKYPVWMSDIYTLADSLGMILRLGEIFKVEEKTKSITDRIQSDFLEKPIRKGSAVYLIWNNPIMAAGSRTFINEMLFWAGFENLTKENRYPEISREELKQLNPDYLLLSSEPFPFKAKHLEEFEELLPNTKIKLVDGELFSWYGSRLLRSKQYFESL